MIPEGWQLVPQEPTDEMRTQGRRKFFELLQRMADTRDLDWEQARLICFDEIWTTALAAAPEPPEQSAHAKERAALIALGWVTMGVGDGSGQLFVHGPHEAIKTLQAKLLEPKNNPTGEVWPWHS